MRNGVQIKGQREALIRTNVFFVVMMRAFLFGTRRFLDDGRTDQKKSTIRNRWKRLFVVVIPDKPSYRNHSPWLFTLPSLSAIMEESGSMGRLTGFTSEEFTADTHLWASRLHPMDRDHTFAEFHNLGAIGKRFMLNIDGRPRTVDMVGYRIMPCWCGMITVSPRRLSGPGWILRNESRPRSDLRFYHQWLNKAPDQLRSGNHRYDHAQHDRGSTGQKTHSDPAGHTGYSMHGIQQHDHGRKGQRNGDTGIYFKTHIQTRYG